MVEMDGFGGGDDVGGLPNKLDLHQLEDIPKEGAVFDATQYAFFGQNARVEEVELGGLEDDECLPDSNEEEFLLNNREEVKFTFLTILVSFFFSFKFSVEDVKSLSDIDDLSTAFWKLNKVEIGPQSTTVIGARGSRERGGEKRAMKNVAYKAADKEVVVQHFRLFFTLRANMARHRNYNTVQSLWQVNEIPSLCLVNEIPPYSTAEWTRRNDDLNWFDQNPYDSEGSVDGRRLSSQPYPSLAPLQESNSLYRTSSYPEQQRQQQPYLQLGSNEPVPNWFDQSFRDSETQDGKRWSSQPPSSIAHIEESKSLYSTSLYPDKQHDLHHFSNDSILAPNSSFTSYPPPGGRSQQASPSHNTGPVNVPYHAVGAQMALSPQNRSHLSNSALQLGGLNHGSPFGGNIRQFPMSSPLNQRVPNHLVNQAGLYNGVRPNISSGLPMINKYDQMLGMMELRDQMPKPAPMGLGI
ncbi:DNA topoisomerase 2-associated protein pat1, variant 2 [Lathyrus oleraceus]|uniref:DNA topoisomerase 2-associated protein pat1, variant 2 n=1 Tax=Pisum sativum TaxID=3888 RepID=A0A9D4YJ83_PEA|nr:DNA topoisomerase 2-associated protein pat1, variant 2 [Pisum sativum]